MRDYCSYIDVIISLLFLSVSLGGLNGAHSWLVCRVLDTSFLYDAQNELHILNILLDRLLIRLLLLDDSLIVQSVRPRRRRRSVFVKHCPPPPERHLSFVATVTSGC